MSIYLPIAEMSLPLPLLLLLGLAVGVLSGLFGIGGGFILTPILIFIGVPPAIAVGTGASQVTAASISGAVGHWRRRNVDLRMGGWLIAGGVFGTITGIMLQAFLRSLGQLDLFTTLTYVVVLGVIGALMLIESARALLRDARRKGAPPIRKASHHNIVQRLPFKQRFRVARLYISLVPLVAIGVVVGWLTAIMGVGGGFLVVPALIYLLRVPTKIALGTSSFQIIFVTVLATLLQASQNFSVDIMLALPLMLGGVIGAQIGVSISDRMRADQLRIVLALLVLSVAVRMGGLLVLHPVDAFSFDVPR